MKTKLVTLLFLLTACFGMQAQTAQSVLGKAAAQLKGNGGIKANFEATTFKGTAEQETTNGQIYIKGDRFKLETPAGLIWFDGKTQWSLYANSGEVNVSTPTQEELQILNPYSVLHLSKQGYRNEMKTVDYNGKSCYEVRLVATQSSTKLREMRLVIDKSSFLPYSIRMKQNGNWFRIRVNQVQMKNKWKDSFFQFNEKDYPDVEVIDLR